MEEPKNSNYKVSTEKKMVKNKKNVRQERVGTYNLRNWDKIGVKIVKMHH